jgi:hypothetical protein
MSKYGKIELLEDYIYAPNYDNSLIKLLDKYDEGVPDKTAASVLKMTIEEYNKVHFYAIMKLRKSFQLKEETESESDFDTE